MNEMNTDCFFPSFLSCTDSYRILIADNKKLSPKSFHQKAFTKKLSPKSFHQKAFTKKLSYCYHFVINMHLQQTKSCGYFC